MLLQRPAACSAACRNVGRSQCMTGRGCGRAPYHTPCSLQRSGGRRGWLPAPAERRRAPAPGRPGGRGRARLHVRRAGTSARCSTPSPISVAHSPSATTSCRCVCGGGSKQRPAPAPSAGARPRPYWRASAGTARALRRILRQLSAPYPRRSFPLPSSPCAVCLSRAACALCLSG